MLFMAIENALNICFRDRRIPSVNNETARSPLIYSFFSSKNMSKMLCSQLFRWTCYVHIYRVKSGNFGHQVNSDIRLQTVEIQMRRLFLSRLIRIFTVCLVNLFLISIIKIWKQTFYLIYLMSEVTWLYPTITPCNRLFFGCRLCSVVKKDPDIFSWIFLFAD